jgi:methylmalonyl-CoA/ethylmalonyl-CoA epimerase
LPVRLTQIHHVGIAVVSLDDALARYTSAFGFRIAAIELNAEQGVREAMLAFAGAGGTSSDDASPAPSGSFVQLLEPLDRDTPVGRFLDRHGEGLHHVAYAVDDIAVALETLAAQEVPLIDSRPRHGSMGSLVAFARPAGLHGVLTELVQAARA